MIVHGVGGHKEDWQGVANPLAKAHHVYAIDMLGFGGSSKNGDDLSMPVQAAAIRALLDGRHVKRADLVGNSVGGWVTATVAATHPDRVHRLILIDAAGFKAMFEGKPPVNFDPNNAEEMQKLINVTINSDVANTPGLAQKAYDRYVASGEFEEASIALLLYSRGGELRPASSAPIGSFDRAITTLSNCSMRASSALIRSTVWS